MSLTLSGTGALTLPSGTLLAAAPATGDRTALVATMSKFLDEFGSSLAASGYQKLPSGLIIQWGAVPAASMTAQGSIAAFTFPIVFPANLVAMSLSMNQTVTGTNTYSLVSRTTSGASLFCNSYASTPNASGTYIAIGY